MAKNDDLTQPRRTRFEFGAPDLPLARLWLALTEKEAEQAKKHLGLLGLEGIQVATILHHIGEARKQLGKATDPDTGTIQGDVPLSSGEVYVLRIGGALHLAELAKTADKQEKLGVVPDDTNGKKAQATDLIDRLDGQGSLFGSVDRGLLQDALQAELARAGVDATVTIV